jgi:hypothetical protein
MSDELAALFFCCWNQGCSGCYRAPGGAVGSGLCSAAGGGSPSNTVGARQRAGRDQNTGRGPNICLVPRAPSGCLRSARPNRIAGAWRPPAEQDADDAEQNASEMTFRKKTDEENQAVSNRPNRGTFRSPLTPSAANLPQRRQALFLAQCAHHLQGAHV